jgi:hypothetical protein
MSSAEVEELSNKIIEFGNSIKQAKQEGKPKEEWGGLLELMLAAKAKYKQIVGEDFGGNTTPKVATAATDSSIAVGAGPLEKNREKVAAKAALKAEKEAKKAAQRAERERLQREKAERLAVIGQETFGDAALVQSRERTSKQWTNIQDLQPDKEGKEVLVRGYMQSSRLVGKGTFVLLRSSLYSVQAVYFAADSTQAGAAMVKYISGLPLESVVDIQGIVTVPQHPVEKATQKLVELQITTFYCISKASPHMPFLLEDAARPDVKHVAHSQAVGAYSAEDDMKEEGKPSAEDGLVRVGQEIRLDHRWIDLRTPANQAIFRIESMVGTLFREFLTQNAFVEIHTPKLIGGASEGGSEVFRVDYFGQPACLGKW